MPDWFLCIEGIKSVVVPSSISLSPFSIIVVYRHFCRPEYVINPILEKNLYFFLQEKANFPHVLISCLFL